MPTDCMQETLGKTVVVSGPCVFLPLPENDKEITVTLGTSSKKRLDSIFQDIPDLPRSMIWKWKPAAINSLVDQALTEGALWQEELWG